MFGSRLALNGLLVVVVVWRGCLFGKFGFVVFLLSLSLSLWSLSEETRVEARRHERQKRNSNLTPLHLCPDFRRRKGGPMGRPDTGG